MTEALLDSCESSTTWENPHDAPWFLYVVECADGTLYAGIATDLERRVQEHNDGPRGARYTRSRRPVTLVAAWPKQDRSDASKAEYRFKRTPRRRKLGAIACAPIRSLDAVTAPTSP